ncbi:hypothetical protein J4422_02785 [Candidatus Pacearchaeota archaeon]|nr:hypothetical protein [Candidatus Pacearchaeota archaeon]
METRIGKINKNLKDILRESDELAGRFSPKLRKKIADVNDINNKYSKWALIIGGLVGTSIGYSTGFLRDSGAPEIVNYISYFIGGSMLSALPGLFIGDKIKERAYLRLQDEYPEKAQDIERFQDLARDFNALRSMLTP